MANYVRQQSFGEIIRGVFDIYTKNFSTIFLIYALTAIPST